MSRQHPNWVVQEALDKGALGPNELNESTKYMLHEMAHAIDYAFGVRKHPIVTYRADDWLSRAAAFEALLNER